eukprot:SAG31_NODE_4326_length_3354_cov_11.627035_3_plen_41_part_00
MAGLVLYFALVWYLYKRVVGWGEGRRFCAHHITMHSLVHT